MKKILIINPTRRIELIEELHSNFLVYVACDNPFDPSMHCELETVIIERDWKSEDLIDICLENEIFYVLPWLDKDIDRLYQNKHLFSQMNIHILADLSEGARLCNDKLLITRYLMNKISYVNRLVPLTNVRKYPIVLKPRIGSGSVGVRIIRNLRELEILNYNPENSILVEYNQGTEYTVDYFSYKGVASNIVPRKRIKHRAGEALIFKTENNSELINKTKELCQLLCLDGPGNMQYIYNVDEEVFQVTDINPRLAGGVTLSIAAGVNYSKLLELYAEYIDHNSSNTIIPEFEVNWNLVASRYQKSSYFFSENETNIKSYDYSFYN